MKFIFASKFYYRRGGVEAYIFKTEALLREQGHSVIPFSTDYRENEPSDYSDYFCRYYELSEINKWDVLVNIQAFKNMLFNRQAYDSVTRLIDDVSPDIFQGFGVTKHLSSSIFKAARNRGVKTIARLSDYALMCPNSTALDGDGNLCSDFDCVSSNNLRCVRTRCVKGSLIASAVGQAEVKLNKMSRAYLDNVDHWIAPSAFIREAFIKHYSVPENRITHVPIFFDAGAAEPSPYSGDYVLYAGRLDREKGLETLFNAMEGLPRVKLLVVGTGPLESRLKARASALGSRVEFSGYRKLPDLLQIIRNSRFLVVPSEWYENSPNIVLEAYALGKPVIGSRIGGIPELVLDERTGLTFQAGDADDLREKMARLHESPAFCRQLGESARALLESRWNPGMHYRQLMSVYDRVRSCPN